MSRHVDDDVVTRNRGGDRGPVEEVECDGLSALEPQRKCLRIAARQASHVMIGPNKQRDEAPAHCSGGAGKEDIQWEPIYLLER